MNLIDAIKNGENKQIEFKVELPNSLVLAKTVIAFSNTGGGKIVIGINDNGEIIGINKDENIFEMMDQITSIIYELCYPTILPDIYTMIVDNQLLVIIEVFRGNLLPYYLKNKGKNEGVYIRVGATNRKASFESILELERQKINVSYDQEINRSVELNSLDLSEITKRFAGIGKAFDLSVMKNLKLVVEENGSLFPTNGLLILLGVYEHVKIMCSRFKGTTMSTFLDRKEYTGDLFTQIDHAEMFIKNHIHLRSDIKGLQRVDFYEIPLEAIRESLVNAVVHRDYSNEGRDIKVGVYDDLINIVSPGGFPSTITSEDIINGRSEIRNKVIARVFKELNYIEQWGSGIRRIRTSCKDFGLKMPEIIEKGDYVDVCLFRESVFNEVVKETTLELTESEELIIKYLKTTQNKLTTKDAQTVINLGERRTREILKQMVEKGILKRVGNTTNAYYKMTDSQRIY